MTKLEEVARAAHEAQWGDGAWDSAGESERSEALAIVRAVVETIREPSAAMLEAGRVANGLVWNNSLGLTYVAPDSAWRAMCDAILNEPPETKQAAPTP